MPDSEDLVFRERTVPDGRRAMLARFRHFLETEWWSALKVPGSDRLLMQPRIEEEVEALGERFDQAQAIAHLAQLPIDADTFGGILAQTLQAFVIDWYRREADRPSHQIDPFCTRPTEEIEGRLSDFGAAYHRLAADGDPLADRMRERASQAEHEAYGRRFVETWFRPSRPPRNPRKPLRLIADGVDHYLAEMPVQERDRITAQLWIDFFGERTDDLETLCRHVHETMKAPRRQAKTSSAAQE